MNAATGRFNVIIAVFVHLLPVANRTCLLADQVPKEGGMPGRKAECGAKWQMAEELLALVAAASPDSESGLAVRWWCQDALQPNSGVRPANPE